MAAFACITLRSAAALAAPDATVAPKATSKFGFVWKDNKQDIGTGAAKSERNSSPYLVYRPAKGAKAVQDKLLVFLHGLGGAPEGYTAFMEVAAAQGYHVIGISYPMAGNIAKTCRASGLDTPSCSSAYRQEVWSGEAKSSLTDVSAHPQDAIHNRIAAAIHYLAQNPGVAGPGWDKFIDAEGKVAWTKLAMAGHSLGSGYAAFVAGERHVDRVVLMSGPADNCDTGKCIGNPAVDPLEHDIVVSTWVKPSSLTPAKAYFGLAHTNDINDGGTVIPRIERIRLSWKLLGLPCCDRTIDGMTSKQLLALSPAPHHLLSSAAVWKDPKTSPTEQQSLAHNAVALNAELYREAWIYMLVAPK